MQQVAYCLALGLFVLIMGIHSHPERPNIPVDPVAQAIFQTAEANRTPDGFLTQEEMTEIFQRFDMNADGNIDETEFIAHWTLLKLGDLEHAVTLFHRADTDRNGEISKNPDFARLFYYFDRDGDHKIAESEFLAVWYSLST
ncbi:uncharacterized protein LOC127838141 [Dreissena polymorpha]|uniref:EF-hand domain-containing protein n=1 Tax=Dreissena polymorpha TaxID=45954 RepID=A0A9D4FF91_DREPO|nr:uncharacterized protein LOC127838141 [Dreissena polymorpha]XP_052221674.1 uncharacterized protein LOC127838141 [Dreissena polymorpha]XP_052221675.1 uncharacterized protein LOC127838141 [Dreissena polymorpha]XP_052221676.1 uncharacterized protein LOC127838141 [Dreissena polymorpha]KAH3797949.1 hypothetical protein DPMN_151539 [Dreissena polymorpha]